MSTTDHGRFCWYDLMTRDPEGSKVFYTELLGWRVDQVDMGEHPYSMIFMGDRAQGGIVPLDGDELPTHWIPYVAVDDLTDSCRKVAELEGQLCFPPVDIGPGTFSVISDPQGGLISLWKSKEPLPEPPAKGEVGTFCWSECMSTDAKGSQAFYEGLFGWRVETADIPVGDCTVKYRMLMRGDQHFGGILDLPDEAKQAGAPTHWLNYVYVPHVDTALEKAVSLGATAICQPTDIPEAGRFCVIQDPQGATLALFKDEA